MKRNNRALPAGIAFAAAVAVLTGCSQSPTGADPSEFTTDPSDISGEVNFSTWWAYADEDLIAGFNEKYPDVTVNLSFTAIGDYPTKLQADASAGALPDVFAVQAASLLELSAAGQLYDLDQALDSDAYDGDAENWGGSFSPSLLSGANAGLDHPDDETWGVPFNAISVASIYNTEIFDEVGITPPASFEELLSNCESLADAGFIPMSLTGAEWISWWPRLAWDQTLSSSNIADFSISQPGYVEGFEKVKQMADAGCWSESQVSADIAGETSLFLQKKTAQFVSVPENFLQAVTEGADFELGTYVLPALDGKSPNRILGGGNANVLAVSAKSDNVSAAVAFAKYLTSTEVQTKLAAEQFTIPALDIELGSSNPLMSAYLTAANEGFIEFTGYMPAFSTAGSTTLDKEILPKLIFGEYTPQQAAEATADLFQK